MSNYNPNTCPEMFLDRSPGAERAPGQPVLVALFFAAVLAFTLALASPDVAAEKPAIPVPSTVNINTADAATLATVLRGVGHARALEIVRYRETYGPFASAEELTEVKGIGQSTLDNNRERITLD